MAQTLQGPKFDLAHFQAMNWNRNLKIFHQGEVPNIYWATCIAEEAGELAGVIKKLYRGFNERELLKMQLIWAKDFKGIDPREGPDDLEFSAAWEAKMSKAMGSEAADIFIYLDLFCTKNNINLWEAIQQKFNQVSDEMGAPEFKIN